MTNFPGAPGVATFYLADSVLDVTPIKTFWTSLAAQFPSGMTFLIPNSGDKIFEGDGALAGAWTGTGGGSAVSGASSATVYSGATGALIRWNTNGVAGRRRVLARTYLVPQLNTIFDNNGSIATANITVIQNAANALIAAYPDTLYAWSRPFAGKAAAGGKPAIPARDGTKHAITSAQVPDLAVVMRSRRI
jgi:hypothetical protein